MRGALKQWLPICCAVLFLLCGSREVFAGGKPTDPLIPDQVVLDGHSYSREEIVDALDKLLFNDVDPPKYRQWDARGSNGNFSDWAVGFSFFWRLMGGERWIKFSYPWLSDYIFRPDGMPKRMAVNKWTKPIRISVGFPLDLRHVSEGRWVPSATHHYHVFGERGGERRSEEVLQENLADLEQVVRETAASLSDLTGLDISYVPKGEDTGPEFSNIRIVLYLNGRLWETPFRRKYIQFPVLVEGSKGNYRHFVGSLEPLLRGVNYFVPNDNNRLDGFLLTDANNEVGLVMCHLLQRRLPGVTRDKPMSEEDKQIHQTPPPTRQEFRGLVRECLMRSLGYIGPLDNGWHSHFANWVDESMPIGRTAGVLDKDLTETDKFFIRLLYRREIYPGMPREEFLRLVTGWPR